MTIRELFEKRIEAILEHFDEIATEALEVGVALDNAKSVPEDYAAWRSEQLKRLSLLRIAKRKAAVKLEALKRMSGEIVSAAEEITEGRYADGFHDAFSGIVTKNETMDVEYRAGYKAGLFQRRLHEVRF